MVRMLVRFRERFEWRARTPAAGRSRAARRSLLVSALPLAAQAPPARAGAADWLVSVQNADGGWGAAPARVSSAAITGWAMLGLEAAGRNPLDVSQGGRTPVDYLRCDVGELESTGDFARTILALEGAGVDAALLRRQRPGQLAGQAPRQQRLLRRLAGLDRLRGDRAARRRRHRRPRQVALLAGRRSRTATAAGATCPARRAPPTAPAP